MILVVKISTERSLDKTNTFSCKYVPLMFCDINKKLFFYQHLVELIESDLKTKALYPCRGICFHVINVLVISMYCCCF